MQETKFSAMRSALNNHRFTMLKFLVIAIAVIAIYFQDLRIIFSGALTTESTFHILAVPFLFAFLAYRKRKMVNASLLPFENTTHIFKKCFNLITGVALCTVAILIYWYGSYSFTPLEFHMVTLPFLTAGLILVLFNTQTLKQLLFPVAFLIFLTPPPSELLFGVGSALANFGAMASNALTNIFRIPATLGSTDIGPVITILRPDSTAISFNVNVACSGIYSLIGFTIFALFIAYITAGKLRNKLFILAIGIPFMILLNIIRITVILAIGYNYGEALALQIFHSMGAAVLMFIGTIIVLCIREKVTKKPERITLCPTCKHNLENDHTQFCTVCGKNFKHPNIKLNKVDITKLLGITLVIVILLSIQAPTFALTQGPAEVMSQTPQGSKVSSNTSVLPDITGYTLCYSYRDTDYEQATGNDAALVYVYIPDDQTKLSIWATIQIGASSTAQHRWETCLINAPLGYGNIAKVTKFALYDIPLQNNPPVTGRFFAFQYIESNQSQTVLYWYQTAVFNATGTSKTKSVMISLITYIDNGNMVKAAENQQVYVAQAINSYWQPLKTWSAITFVISQNGLFLALGTVTILLLLILYKAYLDVKEKRSLVTLYHKLPTQDQLLIKAISKVDTPHSTEDIVTEFQKISTIPVTTIYVTQKLKEAQNNGLITQVIKNLQDNPVLVWKIQLPRSKVFSKMVQQTSSKYATFF